MSAIALQVEADQAPILSQDVASQRSSGSSRLLWTGFGFAALMLMGLLAAHQGPLPAADAERHEMAVLQTMMASNAAALHPTLPYQNKLAFPAEVKATYFAAAFHFAAEVKAKMARGYEARGIRQGEMLREKVKRLADYQAKRNADRAKKDVLAEGRRSADQSKISLAEAKLVADVERDKWGISIS